MLSLLLSTLNMLEITEELSPQELNHFYEENQFRLGIPLPSPEAEPLIVRLEKLLPKERRPKSQFTESNVRGNDGIFFFS